MVTRGQVRRWLRWGGLVAGAAAALGYVFSLIGEVTLRLGEREWIVGGGAMRTRWDIRPPPAGPVSPPPTPRPSGVYFASGVRWWWSPYWRESDAGARVPGTMIVPLWLPLLLGLVCGYFTLSAGFGPGRCARCGYDLRGVRAAGGRTACPECGRGVPDRADQEIAA